MTRFFGQLEIFGLSGDASQREISKNSFMSCSNHLFYLIKAIDEFKGELTRIFLVFSRYKYSKNPGAFFRMQVRQSSWLTQLTISDLQKCHFESKGRFLNSNFKNKRKKLSSRSRNNKTGHHPKCLNRQKDDVGQIWKIYHRLNLLKAVLSIDFCCWDLGINQEHF